MTQGPPAEIVIRGQEYEHTRGVPGVHGNVTLGFEPARIQQTFDAMVPGRALEVCEFSLANYLTLRGTGNDWLTAIPVFPYRAFRQSLAVTRKDSALSDLRELSGRRVGVEDYSMTAAVWFRTLLREEYGVDHRSITWVTRPKQRLPRPAAAKVEMTDADLEMLAADGAIDALLAVSSRDAKLPAHQRRLRTVLRDPEAEARAYYERTGIYPIHHTIVVRNDVIERVPGIVDVLYGVYERAKKQAYPNGDRLSYGWTPENRAIVERLAANLHEQGFIPTVPDVDRLFAKPAPQFQAEKEG